MQTCRYCGRVMGDKACRRHEKVCEKKPNREDVQLEQEQAQLRESEAELNTEEPEAEEPEPAPPPSFPAAMCPDTLVLKENNQMFFKVTGRRIGDVVYIEEVKMDR